MTSTHEPQIDTALSLVGDQTCRLVLSALIERSGKSMTLEALATHVAPENPPPDGLPEDKFIVQLHHHTIPRLEDLGIVEYDEVRGELYYRPDERIEKLHGFVSTEFE